MKFESPLYDGESFFTGLFIGFCAGLILAFMSYIIITRSWQSESIAKGYAQHHAETGVWSWKCDLEEAKP